MKKSAGSGYNLRAKERKSIFQCYDIEENDINSEGDSEDSNQINEKNLNKRKRITKRKRNKVHREDDFDYNVLDSSELPDAEDIYDSKEVLDKLPSHQNELNHLNAEVKLKVKQYKTQFLKEQTDIKTKKSYVGENSVPICADVTNYNFDLLIKKQLEVSQRYFDVIMMDPPWKLSTSQPSRGVAIQYDSLNDQFIEKIPVNNLQKHGGLLIIWAINAKYAFTVHLMEKVWGYKLVDSITWVKKTVNGKIAKGHGFYLQHAKETCLIGIKGDVSHFQKGVAKDVIFSDRRGQSQKPGEIYDYIEALVPNGYYLEIFGRRNNLTNKWVTIGNEI